MDGSIFSSAHGAVDSVVGRLTSLLVSEAQLLSGVRSEVQFISDEMESMNGFILHVAEAEYPDHQVRAWMKQVRDLACHSQDCVDQYAQCLGEGPQGKGIWGYLRRVPWLLRTMPARHRLATRIQELKVRASEVGDRRHRYGVTVPVFTRKPSLPAAIPLASGEEDLWRRALLDGEPPDTLEKGTDLLLQWLKEKWRGSSSSQRRLRVVPIFGLSGVGKTTLAHGLLAHEQVEQLFEYKAFISAQEFGSFEEVFRSILTQLFPSIDEQLRKHIETWDEDILVTMLRKYLKGEKFLIILDDIWRSKEWNTIRRALPDDADCSAGSAVVLTTPQESLLRSCSPYKTLDFFKFDSIFKFYFDRAVSLVGNHKSYLKPFLQGIIRRCYPNKFSIKMFLCLLYANPNRTDQELRGLLDSLDQRFSDENANRMLMFCYNELPRHYRNCLLFVSIFPRGYQDIKRTSLVRRWVAEGLITRNDAATTGELDHRLNAMDEAERCFNTLVARGFIAPVGTGASGKVKSCKVEYLVHDFITRIASDVHFVDTGLPPFLARHLSVRNRIGLQASRSNHSLDSILTILESLPTSSGLQLLRVLDLEGCKGLKKHHLKNICKIILLKYLSLRNTDVTELPKKIKRLKCLETLDVRQTNVRELTKKAIGLPMLKYVLAGNSTCTQTNNNNTDESFLTVNVPCGIRRMKSLEILSHVRISNSGSELKEIAQLMQLRKLGVVLHGKKTNLNDLISQIENLQHLHSLSIRIEGQDGDESRRAGIVETLLSPSRCLGNVITNRLPSSMQKLQKLAKITLCRTKLSDHDLHVLGDLTGLLCLRLRHKSYTESKLIFADEEFKSLKLLVIEGSDISSINFNEGAAPNLEKVVWSLDTLQSVSVSGIKDLPKLKELALNGDCDTDAVLKAIREHKGNPAFRYNGQIVPQEAH